MGTAVRPASPVDCNCYRAGTGLPPDLRFRTKGELAIDVLTDAYGDGLSFDFVCGDEVYGACTALREFLEGRGQAGHDPDHERPVHEFDPRVGEQILGVALLIGHFHVGEDPTDVGMNEPPQLAPPAVAMIEVGTVRIAGRI